MRRHSHTVPPRTRRIRARRMRMPFTRPSQVYELQAEFAGHADLAKPGRYLLRPRTVLPVLQPKGEAVPHVIILFNDALLLAERSSLTHKLSIAAWWLLDRAEGARSWEDACTCASRCRRAHCRCPAATRSHTPGATPLHLSPLLAGCTCIKIGRGFRSSSLRQPSTLAGCMTCGRWAS